MRRFRLVSGSGGQTPPVEPAPSLYIVGHDCERDGGRGAREANGPDNQPHQPLLPGEDVFDPKCETVFMSDAAPLVRSENSTGTAVLTRVCGSRAGRFCAQELNCIWIQSLSEIYPNGLHGLGSLIWHIRPIIRPVLDGMATQNELMMTTFGK
jgi:hypothetical protein